MSSCTFIPGPSIYLFTRLSNINVYRIFKVAHYVLKPYIAKVHEFEIYILVDVG